MKCRARHVVLHKDTHSKTQCPAFGYLLAKNDIGEIISAAPAVFFGIDNAQKTEIAQASKNLARVDFILFPLLCMGPDLLFHKIPDSLSEDVVLFLEVD
jgi:hypothetical protein